MKYLVFVFAVAAVAQGPPGLHVTAATLSSPTTRAMFGKLPRRILAASVQICNESPAAITMPLANIVQQLRLNQGLTVLPRDAALVVVAQAQGRSGWATAFRWVGAGTGTVGTLTALRVIDANAGWGSVIILATSIVGVAAQQFAGVASTHSLLAITAEALPDPLQLVGATAGVQACAQGVVLVEQDPKTLNFQMSVPVRPVLKESE